MTYPYTTTGDEPPARSTQESTEAQPITIRRVLGFIILLPFRTLRLLLLLPFRLLRFILRIPGRIIAGIKKGAWGLYQIRLRLRRGWVMLREARRWRRLVAPRDRVGRAVYFYLHPARTRHRLRSLGTRLRGTRAWPQAITGLDTVRRGLRWARRYRRHRSRFAAIETLRQTLFADDTVRDDLPDRPTTGLQAWMTSTPPRWGALLHGLAFQSDTQRALGLGTGYGIAGLYLARALVDNYPMRTCLMLTIDPDARRVRIATNHLYTLRYDDFVIAIDGDIETELADVLRRLTPVEIAFIDLPLDPALTLSAFRRIRSHGRDGTLIVVNGIHLTRQMTQTWHALRQMRRVAAAVDLWRWGVLVLGEERGLTICAWL